jgi:hypothetical protein
MRPLGKQGRFMENTADIYAEARKHLVARRSTLIKSPGHGFQDKQMEAHIDLIVRIQSVIEVIDRVAAEQAVSP